MSFILLMINNTNLFTHKKKIRLKKNVTEKSLTYNFIKLRLNGLEVRKDI